MRDRVYSDANHKQKGLKSTSQPFGVGYSDYLKGVSDNYHAIVTNSNYG